MQVVPILTPYDARMRNVLNERQRTFQRRFLAARQNIEQTIGLLKGRFHVLQRPARYSLERVPCVVLACCVLHNICQHFQMPMENLFLNPIVSIWLMLTFQTMWDYIDRQHNVKLQLIRHFR